MSDVGVSRLVGARIADVRLLRGYTQEDLGERLAEHLGRPWPRQAVSLAEQGGRAFTAAELVAVARVLGVAVADLFSLIDQQILPCPVCAGAPPLGMRCMSCG